MITVHVDVDNLWIYEQEYRTVLHTTPDSLFEHALMHALDLFALYNVRATFFIVGKDLALTSAQNFCRKALSLGHRIANHTQEHPIDFATATYEEKRREIEQCHQNILDVTGVAPIGFRAPGYSIDAEIIDILSSLHYAYDSSVLPGYANYLMWAYFVCTQGAAKSKLFGRRHYPLLSRKPSMLTPRGAEHSLIELPVSVLPLLRIPMHPTFLYPFGMRYFDIMKHGYRFSPRYHTYLFHAIDFVDIPDTTTPNNPIIPLRWSWEKRKELIQHILLFLNTLSGQPIETTESHIDALRRCARPTSPLLHNLRPLTNPRKTEPHSLL